MLGILCCQLILLDPLATVTLEPQPALRHCDTHSEEWEEFKRKLLPEASDWPRLTPPVFKPGVTVTNAMLTSWCDPLPVQGWVQIPISMEQITFSPSNITMRTGHKDPDDPTQLHRTVQKW